MDSHSDPFHFPSVEYRKLPPLPQRIHHHHVSSSSLNHAARPTSASPQALSISLPTASASGGSTPSLHGSPFPEASTSVVKRGRLLDRPSATGGAVRKSSLSKERSFGDNGSLERDREGEVEAGLKKRVKVGARASIACKTCRKRKVRCSGEWPVCVFCSKRSMECVYEGHPAENGGSAYTGGTAAFGLANFQLTSLEPILPPVAVILEALDPFFLHNYDSFYFLHRGSLTESISNQTAPKELICCILAFAGRFCQSLRDLHPSSPTAASEHYAALASQVLYNPHSSTTFNSQSKTAAAESDVSLVRCQCFLILGLYECTAGIENQGWLKIGIAIRMAQILRLGFEDEDEGSSSRSRTVIDPMLSEVRRRTFWSCFLLDRTITDGKEKPCSLRAPLSTSLRMPGHDVDFSLQRTSLGARLDPSPNKWNVPYRLENSMHHEQEADLYGQTCARILSSMRVRVSEIWQRVSTYIGAGGRNHDRRAPWLVESTFAVLQREVQAFEERLPAVFAYNEANLVAHCMIGQGRLFGMLHLLLACSALVLHRDYLPFLPTVDYNAAEGPIDGEPLYEQPFAPENWWQSLLGTAFQAATTISDLCTSLLQHGSQVTHPFAGYAALAAGTVHCHVKHWPQSSPHSSNAYLYFDQDVGILNSLRDVYPIAASWCDGIQRLHLLYHNLVRGVIAGDPNKVRQSVIRLLRTVKEEDSGSPARESRSNSEGTIGLSSLGMGSHSANGAGLNLIMSSIHESENGGVHSHHDGHFRMALGSGVGGQGGENPFAGTGSDTMDHSNAASPSQGMHMQRGLDLETEYQLDDFVPSDSILFDWSSFSLLAEAVFSLTLLTTNQIPNEGIPPSMKSGLLLVVTLATLAQSLVVPVSDAATPRNIAGDAPYDLSASQMASVISCVGGIRNIRNPYLLVPGTGGTASSTYDGNYRLLLGKNTGVAGGGLGYDVCYVSPPPNMLGDIQVSAECISYAITIIAQSSIRNGGPSAFPVTSWSQGGLALSWTFTFWPSTRKHISNFIAFAPDYAGVIRGSRSGKEKLVRRQGFNYPALVQQDNPSNFLDAAYAKGNKYAWVPTTSLYSATDQVLSPEGNAFNDSYATSFLGGYTGNLLAQGFCADGIDGTVRHDTWLTSQQGFSVLQLALAAPRGFVTQAEAVAAVQDGTIPCNVAPVPGVSRSLNQQRKQGLELKVYTEIGGGKGSSKTYSALEPPTKAYVATFPDNEVHGF